MRRGRPPAGQETSWTKTNQASKGKGPAGNEGNIYIILLCIQYGTCVCAPRPFFLLMLIFYIYIFPICFILSSLVGFLGVPSRHGGTARPGPGPGLFLSPELFLASNDCSLLIGL